MKDETASIICLSLENKKFNIIKNNNNKLFIFKDNIIKYCIRGIVIKNNKITSYIILNNSYLYLPDIEYTNDTDILNAIVKRDKYIELLAKNSANKTIENDILRKKNLSIQCISKDIYNINNINNVYL